LQEGRAYRIFSAAKGEKPQKTPGEPLVWLENIIDSYQIYRARLAGADAVIVTRATLHSGRLKRYYRLIQKLNMRPVIEINERKDALIAGKIGAEIICVKGELIIATHGAPV